ncbi:MAG: hypothetical protein C4313_09260, partial [Thermoflexus sp.]
MKPWPGGAPMALEPIAPAVTAQEERQTQNRLSMVVFSGDMDRLMAAFIIATGAAASGMDVTMFFTFWGLQAIKKKTATGRSLFGRMLGLFLKDIHGVGPSKMNFGGRGGSGGTGGDRLRVVHAV